MGSLQIAGSDLKASVIQFRFLQGIGSMSISIRFQHGGLFERVGDRILYRKGSVFNKNNVDPDLLSRIEMDGFLEDELGICNVKEFWYLKAGYTVTNGLRQILVDNDITSMISSIGRDKVVHVYVVQNEEISPRALVNPYAEAQLRRSPRNRASSSQPTTSSQQPKPLTSHQLLAQDEFVVVASNSKLRRSPRKRASSSQPTTSSQQPKPLTSHQLLAQDEFVVVASDSSSSGSDFSSKESEEEDDNIYDDYVDQSVQDDVGMDLTLMDEPILAKEPESNEDSENLRSLSDSDGEGKVRYPEFNAKADFKRRISLEVGMKFESNDILRRALRQHSIENGGDFYYLHNDKSKISVYCKNKCYCAMQHGRKKCVCKMTLCGFKACARRVGRDGTFQLKKWEPKHDCGWQNENSKVTSIWLAEKYVEHHRDDPGWKISAFMNAVKRDYGVDITYIQAWRARFRAYLMTQGDCSAQYAKVWDYAATLMSWNRGSSAFVKVCLHVPERPLFLRLYICLDACKKGFLNGCRPIISLDGCHLKGVFTGQVLTAVAKDGNENMFPIAYAVVEAERKETWCWFLENLMRDLGYDIPLTFMSDRQKGLLEALNQIVRSADTRVCVRHLHNNFKVKWPGKAFKDNLWAIARAFTTADFQEEMGKMKDLDEGAHAYLMKANPSIWSRSKFKVHCKSDMVLNNICESFNSYILQARDKPILTMCEWIRRALMKRFVSKKTGMMSYVGSITPKAKKRLEIARKEGHLNCRVHFGGGDRFEVDHCGKTYVVDIKQRTCGCNKWDLTGIPCPHAAACILKERKTLEDFVDAYYSKETYLRVYSQVIHPMPGQQEWVKTNHPPPHPPKFIIQPGRPTKARRREEGEERPKKAKRICGKYKCSHCGQEGHNKKKCKNPPKTQLLPKPSHHPRHNKGGRPQNPNTVQVPSHSKRRIMSQSRGQAKFVDHRIPSTAQGQQEASTPQESATSAHEFNNPNSYVETQASRWIWTSQTSEEGASK